MKVQHVAVAAVLSVLSVSVSAQNLKPGLWEVSSKMQTGSGEMEKNMAKMEQQMASMPPEKRKMMEEMMAKQGVKMGAGGTTLKMCMTKEMVERHDVPAQRGDCKNTTQARTGNTMKVAFTCTNPPSSGEGQMTFVSSEAYTSKMVINTTMQGKPEKINTESSGKWLGADCGDIKPPGQGAKK
jgi:hypothetical protein